MYAPLLWVATLVGLSRGYFTPPARLSSLHCMLYVTFCLCTWGAQLCFCHKSSQVFAPFDPFLFFSTVFAPKIPLPPQGAPMDINVYEGISKGALHAVLVHILLVADWDVMGVAWVVRDSLWNGSSVPLGRRLVLAESWALRTLKAASIDMVYAPPLLASQIYTSRNEHWVLRLLLVSPTRMFLCLVLDPLCNKPYIARANTEELAMVNLIAEREGIEPRPQKRWDRLLGEFGSVVFAIAPLYSTFLHQEDGVSCHPACLLILHCLLSRRRCQR